MICTANGNIYIFPRDLNSLFPERSKKMKKKLLISVMALVLAAVMCGCAGMAPIANVETTTPDGTPAVIDALTPSDAAGDAEPTGEVGLANPIIQYESYQALCEAMPGTVIADAPEGATDVVYQSISTAVPPIAEIQFIYDGCDYDYRAAFCDENVREDISGVFVDFNKSTMVDSTTTTTENGADYTLFFDAVNYESTVALAKWYYAPTHCQYSLYTTSGFCEGFKVGQVIDLILPMTADYEGNVIDTSALNAPQEVIPATQSGTVDGTVVSVQDNSIIINMENGNTFTFTMTYIDKTDATAGDKVRITYSGSVLENPEALTITVTYKAEAAALTVSGYVTEFDKSNLFIKTKSGNVYGFAIDSSTKYTGKATEAKVGNEVTVTYTGDLASTPKADEVNTIKANTREIEDALKNKTLNGVVTKLKSNSFTMRAENGHDYTFKKSSSTKITGNYKLAKGTSVKVTYDGYASESPLAKKVDVYAPADPTPAKPTATPAPNPTTAPETLTTVVGTVTRHNGSSLEIVTDYNVGYAFSTAGAIITGDSNGNIGDYAAVTYKVSGSNVIVTKVIFRSVYKPTTAPYLTEYTVSGTVTMHAGNAIEIISDYGTYYAFLIGSARISGDSYGSVGDRATITYKELSTTGERDVTKIVFAAKYPDPTPYKETTVVKGFIEQLTGNYISITTASGYSLDFYFYSPRIVGDGYIGDIAEITYETDGWGDVTVTKIVFTRAVDTNPVTQPATGPVTIG